VRPRRRSHDRRCFLGDRDRTQVIDALEEVNWDARLAALVHAERSGELRCAPDLREPQVIQAFLRERRLPGGDEFTTPVLRFDEHTRVGVRIAVGCERGRATRCQAE